MLGRFWPSPIKGLALLGNRSPVGKAAAPSTAAAAAPGASARRHLPFGTAAAPSGPKQPRRSPVQATSPTAGPSPDAPDAAAAAAADQAAGAGWRDELLSSSVGTAAAADGLVRLVLRGRVAEGMPYRQATLRPIELKGRRVLQLSLLDARQVRGAMSDVAVGVLQCLCM
jgi:hypothetical protein